MLALSFPVLLDIFSQYPDHHVVEGTTLLLCQLLDSSIHICWIARIDLDFFLGTHGTIVAQG